MASRAVYEDTKVRVKASNLKSRTRYDVTLINHTTGQRKTFKMRTYGTAIQKTVVFPSGGVIETKINEPGGRMVKRSVTIGTAEIDCCIAKLVHDAINCTCKCNKCDEDLKRAETIYLLLQSARYEATTGITEMAAEKVRKAKELCTEVCACGC